MAERNPMNFKATPRDVFICLAGFLAFSCAVVTLCDMTLVTYWVGADDSEVGTTIWIVRDMSLSANPYDNTILWSDLCYDPYPHIIAKWNKFWPQDLMASDCSAVVTGKDVLFSGVAMTGLFYGESAIVLIRHRFNAGIWRDVLHGHCFIGAIGIDGPCLLERSV